MRARLRFLQVARLEGWDVATQFAKVKGVITDDPDLVEARKLAAKNKNDKDSNSTPSKFKKGNFGQPAGTGKQGARGAQQQYPQQQLSTFPQQAVYQQPTGYSFTGASQYPTPTYNFTGTQPVFSQQQVAPQQILYPGSFSQSPLQFPSQMSLTSPFTAKAAQPRYPAASATARTPLVCFSCNQEGHKVGECPNKKSST